MNTRVIVPSGRRTALGGPKTAVQWAAFDLCVLALLGLALLALLQRIPAGHPQPGRYNVFFVLYTRFEALPLLLLLGFGGYAFLAVRHGRSVPWLIPSGTALIWIPLSVLVVGLAGWFAAMHAFPLSMDEFAAVFQARVFAGGAIDAPLPGEWLPWATAAEPVYVVNGVHSGSWISTYLPMYSLVRAPFEAVGAGFLTNPLLAVATFPLVAGIAKRAWPDEPEHRTTSVLLLAVSSQFVVMSMTAYAMPAQLFANLLWLWLFLQRGRVAATALYATSALAIGINNPFPHALFAAPFLFRLVRNRRFGRTVRLGVTYSLAAVGWLYYLRLINPYAQQSQLTSLFGWPGFEGVVRQLASLEIMLSWQTPLVALLLIVALRDIRKLNAFEKDLALGFLATLAFYFFFLTTQGHGWGYRYAYPVLGNAILLAAAALIRLASTTRTSMSRLLVCSILMTGLQLPYRIFEVRSFTGPFAHAWHRVETIEAGIVVLPTVAVWYGQDLVRNEPWARQRPLVLREDKLTQEQRVRLAETGSGAVFLTPDSLSAWGIPAFKSGRRWEPGAVRAGLDGVGTFRPASRAQGAYGRPSEGSLPR